MYENERPAAAAARGSAPQKIKDRNKKKACFFWGMLRRSRCVPDFSLNYYQGTAVVVVVVIAGLQIYFVIIA